MAPGQHISMKMTSREIKWTKNACIMSGGGSNVVDKIPV